MNKEDLINFEKEIGRLFENGDIPYLTHLCGGNEEQLIEIFKDFKKGDYVFSTHRAHYHYLMSGGDKENLKNKILNGEGMYLYDKDINFLSSSVLAGCTSIATGVALGLKFSNSDNKVWCFVGDGAEHEGHFYEAVRYVEQMDLPCIFIIEDNDRSVEVSKANRSQSENFKWNEKYVKKYNYEPIYPHAGTNSKEWIKFKY